MKRYIVIILLVLGIGSLYAQHRVGVSLSPAMTWQLDSLPATRSLPGVGGAIGMVYQYQYQSLLLQTGMEFGVANMRQGVDSMLLGTDTLCRNRVDAMRMMEFSIPIMLGLQNHHFYALGGIKAVLIPNVSTTQRATIAIRNSDDRYYEDYNQAFLDDHDIISHGQMTINPDVRACVEVGARWSVGRYHRSRQTSPIMQLGVYAEYGLLNAAPKSYTSSNNDGNASVEIDIDHIYVPQIGAENKLQVNHLHAGIRLTVLFDISPNDCNCEWY